MENNKKIVLYDIYGKKNNKSSIAPTRSIDKEKVKEMICKAIDNIPDCADIVDCYTEHSFGDSEAFIKVHIKVNEETENNIINFHNVAHEAFDSDMGFIS